MEITFLGTGTSSGVPVVGCDCKVCMSVNSKDRRMRSSVMIKKEGVRLLIDVTPDFREQMLGLPFSKIDGILVSHEHYDHVGGMDDLRPFGRFGEIDIYAEKNVSEALMRRIPYCFLPKKYEGVPNLNLIEIDSSPFQIKGVEIIPIRVMHHKLPILGFRIGDFAYLTDVKSIPIEELKKLKDLRVLVVSALRKSEHISHQNLEQALKLIDKINAKKTYLTHLSHEMGLHDEVQQELQEGVIIAFDGLRISL